MANSIVLPLSLIAALFVGAAPDAQVTAERLARAEQEAHNWLT
jgi:hypothetical protein